MSKIEWTGKTWNPLTGCSKVSDGCKNCYAIKHAYRLMHMPHSKGKYAGTVHKTAGGALNWTGIINLDHASLRAPMANHKPTTYFVNSMSDLFHEQVPFDFIDKVFAVMMLTPNHTYQILTKRPERMVQYFEEFNLREELIKIDAEGLSGIDRHSFTAQEWHLPLQNVWLGVSVENQKAADERIPRLLEVPAAIRFLSCEPLLGPVNFRWQPYHHQATGQTYRDYLISNRGVNQYESLKGIHWVIAGGESGHGARPSHPDWFRQLRDQCNGAGVAFFFKQWGEWSDITHAVKCIPADRSLVSFKYKESFIWKDGKVTNECNYHDVDNDLCTTTFKMGKHRTGRLLDGVTHDEMPANAH